MYDPDVLYRLALDRQAEFERELGDARRRERLADRLRATRARRAERRSRAAQPRTA